MTAIKTLPLMLLLLVAPGCAPLSPKVPSFTAEHPANPDAKEGVVAADSVSTLETEKPSQVAAPGYHHHHAMKGHKRA